MCANRFATSSLLCLYHNIACESMLAGGVLVEIDQKPLEPPESKLIFQQWGPFIRDLVASHWKWGIAAVVMREHKGLGGVPMVLDLTRVSVRVSKPVDDVAQYVFSTCDGKARGKTRREAGVKATTATGRNSKNFRFRNVLVDPFGEDVISDVIVFESLPPVGGHVQSKVMALMEEFRIQDQISQTMLKSMHVLQHPQLITEIVPDPGVSSGHVTMAVPAILPGGDASMMPGIPETTESRREDDMNVIREMFRNSGRRVPLDSRLLGATGTEDLGNVHLIHLPEGRKMTAQIDRDVLPNYSELKIAHEERVGAVLGVPRAMWAQGMHRHTSSSDDNRVLFTRSQQALKQFVIPQLHTLFTAIYSDALFMDKAVRRLIAEDEKEEKFADGDAGEWYRKAPHPFPGYEVPESSMTSIGRIEKILDTSAVQVDICLPGIPPQEELKELWMSGVLRYDAYCLYTSEALGIPRRHLNEEPEIPPRDLLGLQPLETEITTTDESKGNEAGTSSSTTTSQRTRVRNSDDDTGARNRKRQADQTAQGYSSLTKRRKTNRR